MPLSCNEYRNWISRALLGDLGPSEQQQLETHLLGCPACTAENELYADTFQQLRSIRDAAVPRHFFVYPKEHRPGLIEFLRSSHWAWKAVAGLAAFTLFATIGSAARNCQFQYEAGVVAFSFGRPLKPISTPSVTPESLEILKSKFAQMLEERSRQDHKQWMDTLRKEVRLTTLTLSQRQQKQWSSALATLEGRVNERIDGSSVALKSGMERSIGNLYQTLQTQRRQDLALTKNRLDRIAVQGAVKDQETDEILTTLLQVAEFKMK